MKRFSSTVAFKLCLGVGVGVWAAGLTIRVVGSRDTADLVLIAGTCLMLAAIPIQRLTTEPPPQRLPDEAALQKWFLARRGRRRG